LRIASPTARGLLQSDKAGRRPSHLLRSEHRWPGRLRPHKRRIASKPATQRHVRDLKNEGMALPLRAEPSRIVRRFGPLGQLLLAGGLSKPTLAGVPGLEPRTTEPESAVLPITPYPKEIPGQSPFSWLAAGSARCRGPPTSIRHFARDPEPGETEREHPRSPAPLIPPRASHRVA
jgi:hypothetical protein